MARIVPNHSAFRKRNRQLGVRVRPPRSPFFELACVLVRVDHVAARIINADHGIV
jgi:hypothetical protein